MKVVILIQEYEFDFVGAVFWMANMSSRFRV